MTIDGMEVVDIIESVQEDDLDAAIEKLENRRARAVEEFDDGLRKLRRLRRTLFGSSGKKYLRRSTQRPSSTKNDGPTPTDKVVAALQHMESANPREIAEHAGMALQGVKAVLRFGKGKRFENVADDVWANIKE